MYLCHWDLQAYASGISFGNCFILVGRIYLSCFFVVVSLFFSITALLNYISVYIKQHTASVNGVWSSLFTAPLCTIIVRIYFFTLWGSTFILFTFCTAGFQAEVCELSFLLREHYFDSSVSVTCIFFPLKLVRCLDVVNLFLHSYSNIHKCL